MCCLEVDDRERWISNQLIILERSSAWLKQILGSLDTKHSLVTSLKREYEEKWHELFIQSRAKLRKKRKMNIRIFFLEKHVQNFLMNNQNNFFFFGLLIELYLYTYGHHVTWIIQSERKHDEYYSFIIYEPNWLGLNIK